MPKSDLFRINYYVGALLAQGGNVWIEDALLAFSPTSTIDRAMGAKDVQIPFDQIRGMEFKGDLMRAFTVTTGEKIHKFEGSQAKKVWEILDKAVHQKAPAAGNTAISLTCDHCKKSLEPGFGFCSACGARIKSGCPSCHKAVNPAWAACAYCGWKFQHAAV